MVGQAIAHYKVTDKLGAGGMGEVYRATDTKLHRDVALKVLPEAFGGDAQRMARFQREAQVLASLNHRNIAAIYGLEESSSVRALAMELVEGPTLAERIAHGTLPLDEALPIAKQIAEALEYAHERGIIHRDLKPANIKLKADGTVKVLDFGLAKALSDDTSAQDISNSPTLTMATTKAGIILGTAAYMSPEQAKGKAADRRADVWSFGAVLFEMLAGRQLYTGETGSEVLARVITQEPDHSALPARTPQRIRELLKRCLTKDPRQRLQAIGEARVAIEGVISRRDAGTSADEKPGPALAIAGSQRGVPWVTLGATVALTTLATAFLVWFFQPRPGELPVRKFAIPVAGLRLGIPTPPALSPDGRKIVYVAGQSLCIRELSQLEPRELAPGVSPEYPFWSPDSTQVAFLAHQKLWRVGIQGGPPTVVAAAGFHRGATTPGAVWAEDGKIIFAPAANGTGLLSVSEQGGDFAEFLARDEKLDSDFHKPSLLPGGKGLLFIVDRNEGGYDTIAAFTGKTRKTILQLKGETLDSPVYSPTGHILYSRTSGTVGIWAVPFSLGDLQITGEPFLVVPGGTWPSVSSDGTLLYSEEGETHLQAVLLNRKGEVKRPWENQSSGWSIPAFLRTAPALPCSKAIRE